MTVKWVAAETFYRRIITTNTGEITDIKNFSRKPHRGGTTYHKIGIINTLSYFLGLQNTPLPGPTFTTCLSINYHMQYTRQCTELRNNLVSCLTVLQPTAQRTSFLCHLSHMSMFTVFKHILLSALHFHVLLFRQANQRGRHSRDIYSRGVRFESMQRCAMLRPSWSSLVILGTNGTFVANFCDGCDELSVSIQQNL